VFLIDANTVAIFHFHALLPEHSSQLVRGGQYSRYQFVLVFYLLEGGSRCLHFAFKFNGDVGAVGLAFAELKRWGFGIAVGDVGADLSGEDGAGGVAGGTGGEEEVGGELGALDAHISSESKAVVKVGCQDLAVICKELHA
jgi:hypothetical protein